MNVVKRALVADHAGQIGRHDQAEIYGQPAGDPGLVGPGSVSWELHGDVAALTIGGVAAIVMEVLHPSVMAGVHDLSSYREEPLRRATTTFGYVVTTTFGSTTAATRLIERVKRMHGTVDGVRPDGVEYRALDPELIGWVHTCIPWAVLRAYERFNRPLAPAERDRYLAEQAVIGRMGGAGDIPETAADGDEYVEAMRPRLTVNEQTREFFEFLQAAPLGLPVPAAVARAAKRFQVEAALAMLPRWARHLTGFEHSPLAQRALYEPPLRTYAHRLRWAYGMPPWRALAEERVASAENEVEVAGAA